MATTFLLMAYCAVLLSLLLLLMKIEDIFNFAELRLAPVQNFLRGEDDFRNSGVECAFQRSGKTKGAG